MDILATTNPILQEQLRKAIAEGDYKRMKEVIEAGGRVKAEELELAKTSGNKSIIKLCEIWIESHKSASEHLTDWATDQLQGQFDSLSDDEKEKLQKFFPKVYDFLKESSQTGNSTEVHEPNSASNCLTGDVNSAEVLVAKPVPDSVTE